MTDHTLTQISHYQKKLEKYAATGENDKLLCCIHKLKYLPVTVNHLEVTGVGKSINGLRHKTGLIGEKARALVHKWKLMVAEEEEQQVEENQMNLHKTENKYTNSSVSQSDTPRAVNEEEYDPSDEGDRLQIQEEQGDDEVDNVTYNPGGHSIENEEENCNGYNPKTSREDYLAIGSEANFEYNPTITNEKRSKHSSSSSERSSLPNGDTHDSHSAHGTHDTNADKVKKDKSHKSREESKHKKKKHKSKHDHEEKPKSNEEENSSDNRKSKHKSSKSKDKKRDKERESNKQSSHSSSSKSHSSSSRKSKNLNVENSSPVNSSYHGNSSTSSSNPISSSDVKRHRESDDERDSTSKKTKSSEKQKEKKSHKSSKSSKDDHKSSKRKREEVPVEAPSEFEAALMGMDSTPSKKKKKKKSKEKEKKEVLDVDSPSPSPSAGSPKLKELDLDYREQLPQLPSSFEAEVISAPQLMTHYKPLPHVPQRSANKDPFSSNMTNEEALNYMFTSKSSKQRRIYAGKATGLSCVPSLFNICIRVLQENIDALETTGGIPYDILRPVLEKASPQQLFSLEDYNPYLLEDTDVLWAAHCRKSFRNKQREDMETWREMFIRCTDEHQERMRSITESLQKKYITKAIPKRTTQLAYINTAAKPPKSVARAQARYGTASTKPAPARLSSKTAEPQIAASSSSSNSNGSSSSNSNAVPKPEKPFPIKPPAIKKPKVAPLMGKARQLMKKVCRR